MKKKEMIEELLDSELYPFELVEIWNEYCDDNRYEDTIYTMDEIDTYFCDCAPSTILESISGSFNPNDEYFKDSIYGVHSFDCPEYEIDIERLVDWLYDGYTSPCLPDELLDLLSSEEYKNAEDD